MAMANTKNDDSDTLPNRELEFCYQFTTHFFNASDVSKEFDAGGKTKDKTGHKSEIMGMSGYAAGSTAGEALGAFLPHPLSNVPGKVLAKAGNTLFKKIAIILLTKEQREKDKKIHDVVQNEHLDSDKFLTTCIQATLSIFRDYECQFKKVTRKEKDGQKSWKRAMSKLSEEATERCFDYIVELTSEERDKFAESFKDPCDGSIAIYNAVLSGKCKQSVRNVLRAIKKGHKLHMCEDKEKGFKKEVETTTGDFFDRLQCMDKENTTCQENETLAGRVQEILDYIIKRDEKFGDKHIRRVHQDELRELIDALKSNLSINEGLHEQISEIHSAVVHCNVPPDMLEPITYGNPLQIDRFMKRKSLIKEAGAARESKLRVIIFYGPVGTGKTQEAIRYALAEREDCKVDIIFLQSETVESLKAGLKDFANSYLGMPRDSENTYLFGLIVSKLRRREVIFVLDNVNDESVLLEIPIISMPESHRVLVTTQVGNLFSEKYCIINVNEFGPDLATRFYKRHLHTSLKANDRRISHLIKKIGTIPMYVQLTCSYLNDGIRNNEDYSIRKFLIQLDRQVIPEYFRGTVDSVHCVNPIGGPMKVWAMVLEKVKAKETVGEVALEILSVISYLRSDKIAEEYVKNVFGKQVSPKEFDNALKLLSRFHIIGRRTEGLTKFIQIYPMVQATIRNLDENKKNQTSLGKILNLFIQNDMANRREYKHTEGLFLPPHFHTVFKHAVYNDLSFSKFERKILDLWRSPIYTGTYDKLFQLEILLSVSEKNLAKSDISDWLKPFNQRHRALGIEDLGIKSEINGGSCDNLYNRIFSLLDKNGPNIQIEVVKFALNRTHYTWCNYSEGLAVKMYEDAYVVDLQQFKIEKPELQVLQSIFYMGSHRRIFYMDFFKLIHTEDANLQIENMFEKTYYQFYYNPSKKFITVFPGALIGAKSHLEKTGQDVPILIYIASIFKGIIDQGKFESSHSKYLESILDNLNNKGYSRNTELQNFKNDLETWYKKYMETNSSQYKTVNTLFEHLSECIIRREGTCEHNLVGERGEFDFTGTTIPICTDSTIPPEKAKPIISLIVDMMNAETHCNLALQMIAHLDVGVGSDRFHTDPIIKKCEFLRPSGEEMLEDFENYRFVCSFQRSPNEKLYRRVEDTRPQYTLKFPSYLTNNAYTQAYSWVMEQIRLQCKVDNETVNVLRRVLLGLKNLGTLNLYGDEKLYYMKLFRNIWTLVIQEGHHDLLIEFSELLSWSMKECFGKDCSNFLNILTRECITDFTKDTPLPTTRLIRMDRGIFANKETTMETLIHFVLNALSNDNNLEFLNESRLIALMGNFEKSCGDYGFRELNSNENMNRHKTPWIDTVDDLLCELENKE